MFSMLLSSASRLSAPLNSPEKSMERRWKNMPSSLTYCAELRMLHPQPNMSCVRPAMSPLRSGPTKRTAIVFLPTRVERPAGGALVSGVGLGERVARASRFGARLVATRDGEGARAETPPKGKSWTGRFFAGRPFGFSRASFRARKGHVAPVAPFATNVLSSGGPFDGAVPGRTLDESFTFATRAASLEGSMTAVATVRAPSRCRFARPDEKRAAVLIPESGARARLRVSPRCGARAREKVATGMRRPYASVEVIFGR